MPFQFGQILEATDICDRESELTLLEKLMAQHGRAIIYGRRRFGKTSVLRNLVIPRFMQRHKGATALYVDLFQITSLADVEQRFRTAFESALKSKVNLPKIWTDLKQLIQNFKMELSVDPLLSRPNVTLSFIPGKHQDQLENLFANLHKIAQKHPTLLIIDEVQDILLLPGFEGKLRNYLQQLNKTAVILTGSKHHVITEMMHNERRPFYGFGTELDFGPIPVKAWLPYMRQRFKETGMSLGLAEATEITQLMDQVPNAIQELCQWIAFRRGIKKISKPIIHESIADLLDHKQSRYWERLAALSEKERNVLVSIAKNQPVANIGASTFCQQSGVSPSGIKAAVKRFYDQGLMDRGNNGYQLSDPLFGLFLARSVQVANP